MGNAADDRLNERSRPASQTEIEFPQYLMFVDGVMEFMTLRRAGFMFNSGWFVVKIHGLVLDGHLNPRNITEEEKLKIWDLADRCDADL